MAKIVILFSAFLLASGAHGAAWTDGLIAAQEAVNAAIDTAIVKVQSTIEYADLRAESFDSKLNTTAAELEQKMYAQIRDYMAQVDARLVELYKKADGIDIQDCEKIAETLENVTLSSITVMNACVDDKVKLGADYVAAIKSVSESSISKLNGLREDAIRCSENVDGFQAAAKAIVCTKIVGAKASIVSAKSVPALVQDVTKLIYLASTLHLTIPACVAKKGYRSLVWESGLVLNRVKTCINRKIIQNKKFPAVAPGAPEATTKQPVIELPGPELADPTPEQNETIPEISEVLPKFPYQSTPIPELPEFNPEDPESHPHKVEDLFPKDDAPIELPTEAPIESPTEAPKELPTEAPKELPTEAPKELPTEAPKELPTEAPKEATTEHHE